MPVCSPVTTSPLSYSDHVTGLFNSSTTTWKQEILWRACIRPIRTNKELQLKKQLSKLKSSYPVSKQYNVKSYSVFMKDYQAICFQRTMKKGPFQKHIRTKPYKTCHDISYKRCHQRGIQLLKVTSALQNSNFSNNFWLIIF